MKIIKFWETEGGNKDYKYQKKIFSINYPNEGKYVKKLEDKVKKILKIKYCVALPSGTSAMFVALKILNLKSYDEVIVPNITFAATANAVNLAGAKVILVDVNPETLNIDIKDLEKKISNRTRVIMPVHISGRSCDMTNIIKIAKRKKIKIIEDAAEAFLSMNKNKYLGTIGDMGCFSLSPNKIFTSGQGGLLVTNNKKYFDKIKVFKTQGRVGVTSGGDDLHISVGGNFKLSNISAGLALSQLDRLYKRKNKLTENYKLYKLKLNSKKIKILKFDIKNNELPLWTDVICESRDKLYNYLRKNNIICRKFWFPLSKKNFYSHQKHSSFKNTNKIEKNIMWLPSSFLMKKQDQLRVIEKIKIFYKIS